MYIPDHFAIKDVDSAYRIIEAHPLGTLVTLTSEGLDANHIPFELDAERGMLTAHVARANPVWRQCANGVDALVIFRGRRAMCRRTGIQANMSRTDRFRLGTIR